MSASVEVRPAGDSANTSEYNRPDVGFALDTDGDVLIKTRLPDRNLYIGWSDWQMVVAAMERRRQIHEQDRADR